MRAGLPPAILATHDVSQINIAIYTFLISIYVFAADGLGALELQVVLTTSMGEIDVELWSKEAPMACRNFVQLCLEVQLKRQRHLCCEMHSQARVHDPQSVTLRL